MKKQQEMQETLQKRISHETIKPVNIHLQDSLNQEEKKNENQEINKSLNNSTIIEEKKSSNNEKNKTKKQENYIQYSSIISKNLYKKVRHYAIENEIQYYQVIEAALERFFSEK